MDVQPQDGGLGRGGSFHGLGDNGPANHIPLGSATFHSLPELATHLLERGADANTAEIIITLKTLKPGETKFFCLNRGAE